MESSCAWKRRPSTSLELFHWTFQGGASPADFHGGRSRHGRTRPHDPLRGMPLDGRHEEQGLQDMARTRGWKDLVCHCELLLESFFFFSFLGLTRGTSGGMNPTLFTAFPYIYIFFNSRLK